MLDYGTHPAENVANHEPRESYSPYPYRRGRSSGSLRGSWHVGRRWVPHDRGGNSDQALELLAADSDTQLLFTERKHAGANQRLGAGSPRAKRVPQTDLPIGSWYEQKPYSPDSVISHARELTLA
jgi:hypothetical protein